MVGEHAHVVQPITKVNGKWVVYGLGNAVAQSEVSRTAGLRGDHRRVHVPRDPAAEGSWWTGRSTCPTYWNHYASGHPIRVQRVVQALARGIGDPARLREALAATRASVNLLGHPAAWCCGEAAGGRSRRRGGTDHAAPAYACACGGLLDQPGRDTEVTSETALVVWDGETETIVLRLSTRTDAVTAGLLVPTPSPATADLADDRSSPTSPT